LVTAVLWFSIVPLRGVLPFIIPFAVVFQEFIRYIFWRLYEYAAQLPTLVVTQVPHLVRFALCVSLCSKAYNQTESLKNDPTKPPNFMASLSIGWGIGTTMALIMQTSVATNAFGPGDLPAQACPSVSLFHIHGPYFNASALLPRFAVG
jgi:hypothetical protein